MTPLRIVFFGTPEFAVPSLTALLSSRHQVVAAVTQPDRARGRGWNVSASPVKLAAQSRSVPVLQPEALKRDEWLQTFGGLAPDLAVVAAYGRLLPQTMLDVPRLGFINVHASLLPRWRGAAPVHRAILAGDRETGITIMRVVLALDAGPMIDRIVTPIDENETSEMLERRLADLGAQLLARTVDRMTSGGKIEEVAQDDSKASYAPRIERADSAIDWAREATAVHNQIRGLHPWPLASTNVAGKRLLVLRSTIESVVTTGMRPGTVLTAKGDDFTVSASSGGVRLLEVQPEGRKPMRVRDFLNGTMVATGSVLGSTS